MILPSQAQQTHLLFLYTYDSSVFAKEDSILEEACRRLERLKF
jgi:hypothetical protein